MKERTKQVRDLSAILSLPGPLSVRLAACRLAMRDDDPGYSRAYDGLTARIAGSGMSEAAPGVGDRMPPFVLPDVHGRFQAMDDYLQTGPLVVSFNRGHWCPFCRLELAALAATVDAAAARAARIVSIMPDRAAYTASLSADLGDRLPILSDIGNAYALQVGVTHYVGDDLQAIMAADGIDLERVQGEGGGFMPFPATFVIDRNGRVAARHLEPDFRTRMDMERVLASLDALSAGSAGASP